MEPLAQDLLKLALAVLLGGLIGAEREFRDKAAGFRTIIFITVGAALFTILSRRLGGADDPVRIAANIVSGVGFLGAGAILRDGGRVTGLTTAATIWLAAALGMGVGGGHYLVSLAAGGLVFVVLAVFPRLETWIDRIRDARTYEVSAEAGTGLWTELEGLVADSGLEVVRRTRSRSGSRVTCTWTVIGSPRRHDELAERLMDHEGVLEIKT